MTKESKLERREKKMEKKMFFQLRKEKGRMKNIKKKI